MVTAPASLTHAQNSPPFQGGSHLSEGMYKQLEKGAGRKNFLTHHF